MYTSESEHKIHRGDENFVSLSENDDDVLHRERILNLFIFTPFFRIHNTKGENHPQLITLCRVLKSTKMLFFSFIHTHIEKGKLFPFFAYLNSSMVVVSGTRIDSIHPQSYARKFSRIS